MARGSIATLVLILARASLVFGQAQAPTPSTETEGVPVCLWEGVVVGQAQAPTPSDSLPPPRSLPPAPAAQGAAEAPALPAGPAGDWLPWLSNAWANSPGMFLFDADYALWLVPNERQPETIARTINNGVGGVDTLGDEHLDKRLTSGAQFAAGYWLTEYNPWVPWTQLPWCGAETRFFFVGQRSYSFTDAQSQFITRPFFDINDQVNNAVVVQTPGLASGSISASDKENLWGGEANLWTLLHAQSVYFLCTVEGMVGLRYLELNESFTVSQITNFVSNPVNFPTYASLAGNTITEQDSFSTRNQFWGGQLGFRIRMYLDNVVVTGQFQLGLGSTFEEITIQGSSMRTAPGGPSIASPGALLALPSNIGTYQQSRFTQVPEGTLNLTFPVSSHFSVSVGFTALYWSRLVHPGSQIDEVVNITQIPNFPAASTAPPTDLKQPTVPFKQSDMILLGTLVSAEVKW
jgi:hypothetical protein